MIENMEQGNKIILVLGILAIAAGVFANHYAIYLPMYLRR